MAIAWKTKSSVEAVAQSPITHLIHKPVIKQVASEESILVDELIGLSTFLIESDVAKKLKRVEELKKSLQSIAIDMPADKEAVFKSESGEVIFGPRSTKTTITDKDGLRKKLGEATYFELASVGLTEVKKYLSEIEMEIYSTKEYGSRSLKSCKPVTH
jgi:hypothetical protein